MGIGAELALLTYARIPVLILYRIRTSHPYHSGYAICILSHQNGQDFLSWTAEQFGATMLKELAWVRSKKRRRVKTSTDKTSKEKKTPNGTKRRMEETPTGTKGQREKTSIGTKRRK